MRRLKELTYTGGMEVFMRRRPEVDQKYDMEWEGREEKKERKI